MSVFYNGRKCLILLFGNNYIFMYLMVYIKHWKQEFQLSITNMPLGNKLVDKYQYNEKSIIKDGEGTYSYYLRWDNHSKTYCSEVIFYSEEN